MKKVISLLLAVVLLASVAIPAYATPATESESVIQPRWSYLDTVTAYLDINTLGIATCRGTATAHVLWDVKVTVRLQQLTDTGWYTVKSWSATELATTSVSGKYAVYSGYTYRTTVTAYVYDENGSLVETGSASDTFVY